MEINTLDRIKELRDIEDRIHQKLRTTTEGEKQEVMYSDLNTLSKVRNALYDGFVKKYSVVDEESDDQEKKEELSRIIENTLEDTSTDLSSLKTSVDNNNRLYEINTYDIKNYEAYNGVMVIVLYTFIGLFIVLFLRKRFPNFLHISIAKFIAFLIMSVSSVTIIYRLNDINKRDNMNYDKYNWSKMSSDSSKSLDYIHEPSPVGGETNDISGVVKDDCQGEKCCGDGTTYSNVFKNCIRNDYVEANTRDTVEPFSEKTLYSTSFK